MANLIAIEDEENCEDNVSSHAYYAYFDSEPTSKELERAQAQVGTDDNELDGPFEPYRADSDVTKWVQTNCTGLHGLQRWWLGPRTDY